tara:strand:- start:1900 stop:2094 length:195 start_codon:yes stop_codon:yes gene_type:complete
MNKLLPLTAVTRDLGICLNVEMVLFLGNLCLTEKTRIFSPKPRVAATRYQQTKRQNQKHKKIYE